MNDRLVVGSSAALSGVVIEKLSAPATSTNSNARGVRTNGDRVDTSWFEWPRYKHSEKPEAFQDIVERVCPGPYLEIFARRKRLGWHAWGNEVPCDVER